MQTLEGQERCMHEEDSSGQLLSEIADEMLAAGK
jgi:hypothetical protein